MSSTARVIAVLLALLVITAAVIGPLMLDLITFHVSASARAQYVGGEIATLIGAMLLLAAALAPRPWLTLLVPGICAYLAYTFVTVIVGQNWPHGPAGSAGHAFFLYAAITGLATTLAVLTMTGAWPAVAPTTLTSTRVFLGIVAVLFALLWALQVAALYAKGPTPEYAADPALFWLIKLLDYGFVIPVFLLIAIGLGQPHPAAVAIAPVALTFAALLACAIAGMGVSQAVAAPAGQGSAGWVMGALMLALAAGSVAVLWPWLRVVSRGQPL